ncbi:MAG: putative cAMP-dependent protein kinase regulatory subunit [Gammaproteobacteria bacterium]|nr:putative cAMP-dependent protein kinase regulatory subunit [Gammaproteobacteria bacterium]
MHNLESKFKEIPLFADLLPEELAQLMSYLQPFSAPAGTRIISQATKHRGLHILLSGSVEVWLKIFGGTELNIASLKTGDIFGEVSLLSNFVATSSVIAKEDVTGILLTPNSLQTISVIYRQLSDKIKHAIALRCCERSRQLLHYIPSKAKHQEVWQIHERFAEPSKKGIDSLNTSSLREFLQIPGTPPFPIPFFNTLSQDEIDLLSSLVKLHVLYRGDIIHNSDIQGECFYWPLWGAVQAMVLGDHRIKIATYGPGEVFGTVEYIDKLAPAYRYIMREDGIYLSLNKDVLATIKERNSLLWDKIMRVLWSSIGAQMACINWIFLQLNVEDMYQAGQEVDNV